GLHVDLTRMSKTASGVFYFDSIRGTGTYQARPGDQLTVHYSLWLPDGTLVDNNSGGALSLTLSNTNVIQGWVDGLSGAVQGTTRQLVVPPELAYKDAGSGSKIPPNATLVFLVTIDRITPASSSDIARVNAIAAALLGSGAAGRFR
ncbi:MAG TPA: FKBP-type peptidyl-prolyl cis-trans isomerase, partial [Longimicrobiales bacterium]